MNRQRLRSGARRGLTRADLVAGSVAGVVLLASVIPGLAAARQSSFGKRSAMNLMTLGAAHVVYAADWNGRQYTNVVDDISSYGSNPTTALQNYNAQHNENHPPVLLGWGESPNGSSLGLWGYWMDFSGNWSLIQPIRFDNGSNCSRS